MGFAPVAGISGMNNGRLFFLLLLEMLHHELLILLRAVLPNLDLENVVQILEELGLQLARSIAFLAWQALLVDLWAITSEAVWQIITELEFFVEISRPEDEAAHLLLCADGVFLACLGFSVDFCAAHYLFEAHFGLGADFICWAYSVDVLFGCSGGLCVAAETVLDHLLMVEILHHIPGICGCWAHWHLTNVAIISTGDRMRILHLRLRARVNCILTWQVKRLFRHLIELWIFVDSFSMSCWNRS